MDYLIFQSIFSGGGTGGTEVEVSTVTAHALYSVN